MFPVFTNAALLAGLAGLAAPILIHLLLRRRSQRLRFSTVQFFVKKDEQSMRKRKLRNLLLLSLRVILFTLLVLAFARPYLPNIFAGGTNAKRQQAVILLDASASMQSAGSGGQQWKRAKAAAKQVLASLQNDDRAALVLCSTHSSAVSGFVPPSVLARKLDDIPPGFGVADLGEGLQQALKVLSTANPAFETSLHVISDLQRPATQNIGTVPLPRELAVKIPDSGDRFVPNVTVTDLRLERNGDLPPQATITSFSDDGYAALPYRLTIDGKEILAGTVPLQSSASTNLPLAIPTLKPGWHSAEFTIQAKDSLSLDDTRFATILVPEPIRCVVIEPRPSARAFQEESFFLTAALNPAAAGEVSASRFSYEKASLENFGAKLQPQAGRPNVQVIVLPAVRQISSSAGAALKSFVQNGGGLLLFVGEGVSANSYNTAIGELLPAELERIEPAGENGWHVGEFQKNSPVFSLFAGTGNGNLALHEFTQRFSLKARPGSVVTAQFDDGAPLVIERKVGEGRIILVNTSADTRWTDWQKHKSFLPWLHSTAFYLSGRNPLEQRETAPVFNSGSEVDLGVAVKEQPVKMQRIGGEEIALHADQDGVLRDVPLAAPGIYSVKDGAGVELRRIAVNIPSAESDLTFAAPGDTDKQLVRRTEPEPVTLTAGLFGQSPQGKELWRLLLVGALLFLVIEPIIANKTAA
jgi:hypothetical protein